MVDHVVLWFLTSIFSLLVPASPFAKGVFFVEKTADKEFGFYWFNDLLAGPWVLAQSLWLVETWKIRKVRLQEKPEELHNMSPLFRNTSNKVCKTHLCSCSSGMNLGPQSRNTLAKNMRHAESCWQKDVPFAGQQFSWDRCMFESTWNSGLCFFRKHPWRHPFAFWDLTFSLKGFPYKSLINWCLDTTDINGWHPSFPFSKKRWHTNSVKELPIQNLFDTMLWVTKRWPGSAIFIHDPENHHRKHPDRSWLKRISHVFWRQDPGNGGNGASFGYQVGEVRLVSWHDVFGIIWM